MSLRHTSYDADLQMFVDSPREPDMQRLTFLRWLVEQRRLEHEPAGPPSGALAVWPSVPIPGTVDRRAA